MSQSEPFHAPSALNVIRDEHRAMAAVLDGLAYVVRNIDAGRMRPDYTLLASMVDYIAEMPDKLHHPKEDRIFALLRPKTHDLDGYLDSLEEEHRRAVPATSALDRALVHYLQAGADGFGAFRDTALSYTSNEFKHMGMEERYIFPAARRLLTADEWQEVNADFSRNSDPWAGLDDRFVKLFRQIAMLAPAPIGLGDPQT
ncbi:MAG: hemerythrin domain-containing protein [Castellaniella sp.]|uniref:hemerythrin domain-containing protein n=1 Tax=Castellaniella sp. TaxID=1955812 RepID=UPI00120266FB|nr:hemerythrin domain-containing protein [Castellaniella sp.]TAN26663.1 MAG: hemerythrin domain-containing protein [Castellaniella sp.]